MTDESDESEPKPRAKVLGREDKPLPKRFYKEVGLGATLGGFAVLLDGRPIKTPAKDDLVLPREALATAVAQEWAVQGTFVDPATMPLLKLCNTAIDRVQGREAEIVDELTGYAGTDLVCYRADRPQSLVAAQAAAWDPVLGWAKEHLNAPFVTATGLMHKQQSPVSIDQVRAALTELDAFALCALHNMTTLTGSILLSLAHVKSWRGADRASKAAWDLDTIWTAAHVDEDYQIATWGADEGATRRRANRWREMQAAGRLLVLAGG
jgi:chaperone required for assembly of F1-ATPase